MIAKGEKMLKKLVVLGLLLLVGSGCASEDGATEDTQGSQKVQKTEQKAKSPEKGETLEVKAENGEMFRYTLLKGWKKRKEDGADLSLYSGRNGLDLLLESKEDYVDFPSYQNGVKETIRTRGDKVIEEETPVEIQGMPGVEMVVEFSQDGRNYKTLLYLLESEQNYVQINSTTQRSRFEKEREKLKEAAKPLVRVEQ